MDPYRVDRTLRDFLVNCYIIPLNSQGKLKIKINGKLYQILINTGASIWGLGRVGRSQQFSGENSYQSQLSQTPVYNACGRRRIKFHAVPSPPNPVSLVLISSLPETTITFLFVLFCVLRTWLRNCQVEDPKIWPDRNVGCTPFMVSYCWADM